MSNTALFADNPERAAESEGKFPVQSFPLRVISLTVGPTEIREADIHRT